MTYLQAAFVSLLLTGYSAHIITDKEGDKIQSVLNGAGIFFDSTSASTVLLNAACCSLLRWRVHQELGVEAHAIIDGWKLRELTREEFEMVEHLKVLE